MMIWDIENNEEDIYRLSPITVNGLEEIENTLSKQLPTSYKDVLLTQNGGYLKHNAVILDNEEDYLVIDHIYGGGSPGILDSSYLSKEWGLPHNLIIFSGEGNQWFALDYQYKNPIVIYIDQELEEIIQVAENFDEFLQKLRTFNFEVENGEENPSWTIEEAEEIFLGEDNQLIEEVLISFQYTDKITWYYKKLLELSNYSSLLVRETVLSIIRDNIGDILNEAPASSRKLIKDTISNLEKDSNKDIVTEINEIKDMYNI
ncbi:SMI1/KNR4 family protein [Pontibacillus sp. ALD_SL1]|uniref:SMI1/KNR4 family protein n=1 Tax=Pontibacillus sp. ALD_SL1 TaxID=2777185 RepID=UPI001A959938|nr:SMI1/KNR4 family protein [Pontibacillus sp. ALD_SL1]QSS99739.1 SMI1/KNR4 family protein [Pontibacillus sp. ALD_SL1]